MAKLTHTVSGNNVASFRSADIANIESLKCYFLPVQEGSGDPSPENIRPITGWQEIEVSHINKNFIRKYYTTSTEKKGLTIIPTERGIHISGTATARTACMLSDTNHIPFKTNDKVTFSLYLNGDISQCENPYVGYYKKVGVYGNATGSLRTDNNYTFTWTVPSAYGDTDESYIDSYIYIPQGVTVDFEIGLQAELASTLSTFEPHKESIIPITFSNVNKNKLPIGTVSFTQYKKYVLDKPLPPGTYTISATVTSSDIDSDNQSLILFEYAGENERSHVFKYLSRNTRNSQVLTIYRPCSTVYIYASTGYVESEGDTATWTDVQLEVGNSMTAYEPYNFNNIVYGGYIDIAKGEIVETHKKKILNGTETWSGYRTASDPGCHFVITLSDKKIGLNGTISDTFPNANNIYFWDRDDLPSQFGDHGTLRNLYFNAPYPMTNGIAEWKQWLSEHNVTIIYPLETPIHHPILKQNIDSFLNQNHIWSNTNNTTEVTYEIIDHLTVKRANIPRLKAKVIWNSLAYPQIKSGQVVNSSGNGTFHITCTMTKADYYTLTESDHYMTIIKGHKYYIHGCPVTDGSIWLLTTCGNNGNQNDKGYGTIATFPKSSNTIRIQIRLEPGTYDFYITPVIVDLTQMFGAGNEPTLVEFEQLCKMNGVNINEAQPFDLGTEKIWYINNYDITKCNIIEWNQNAKPINSSNYKAYNSEHIAVTFEDNVLVSTWLTDGTEYGWSTCSNYSKTHALNHYYYLSYEYYTDIDGYIGGDIGGITTSYVQTLTNQWTRYSIITLRNFEGNFNNYAVYVNRFSNQSNPVTGNFCKARNIIAMDLTQMFGAGNEPLTVEELQATCLKNNINLNEAQPYNTGTKMIWKV